MNEEDIIAPHYTQNRGIYGMLRTSPYIPLYYRMWNLSTSKMKLINLHKEIYRPQKEIYRLRIRILSIQTVNLSVDSVGPIADYSHSIMCRNRLSVSYPSFKAL